MIPRNVNRISLVIPCKPNKDINITRNALCISDITYLYISGFSERLVLRFIVSFNPPDI